MAVEHEYEETAREILDFPHPSVDHCLKIGDARKHFFVTGFERLSSRARGLDEKFRALFAGDQLRCPPKDTLKHVLNEQPITLTAACKLKLALDHIAANATLAGDVLKTALTPPGASSIVRIMPNSVVPSVYIADRKIIEDARKKLVSVTGGTSRIRAAKDLFGSGFDNQRHAYLFQSLEVGEENKSSNGGAFDYRITRFLAQKVFEYLRETLPSLLNVEPAELNWELLFSSDPTKGSKAGDTTKALPVRQGNILYDKKLVSIQSVAA